MSDENEGATAPQSVTEMFNQGEEGQEAASETPPAPEGPKTALTNEQREELERREREIFEEKTRLAAQSDELERYRNIERLRKEDPMKALQELGIDRLSLTEQILGEENKPQVAPEMQKVFDHIKKQDEKIQSMHSELLSRDDKRALYSAVQTKAEDYPFLSNMAQDDPGLIDQVYREVQSSRAAGQRPNIHEILAKTEKRFADDIFASLTTLSRHAKIKDKLAGLLQGSTQQTAIPSNGQPPKTLKNVMSGEAPQDLPKPKTPEEANELLKRMNLNLWEEEK